MFGGRDLCFNQNMTQVRSNIVNLHMFIYCTFLGEMADQYYPDKYCDITNICIFYYYRRRHSLLKSINIGILYWSFANIFCGEILLITTRLKVVFIRVWRRLLLSVIFLYFIFQYLIGVNLATVNMWIAISLCFKSIFLFYSD